jgi:hypothetical protein
MVDAVDLGFIECFEQRLVQLPGGFQVMPEWLFEHQAGALPVTDEVYRAQVVDDGFINRWRGGEVEYALCMFTPGFVLGVQYSCQIFERLQVTKITRQAIRQVTGKILPLVSFSFSLAGKFVHPFQQAVR